MPKRNTPQLGGIDDPRYVKALAHPLRIRILAMLGERDASPVQLAQRLDASLGTIAYHVRTLENLGLIKLVGTHQRRGATEHVYRALPQPVITDHAWSLTAPVAKQAMIGATLQQAGDYATRAAAAGGFDRPDALAVRGSFKLDEQGWHALAARAKEWYAEAQEMQLASDERTAATGEQPLDIGLVMLLFEALPFLPPAAANNHGRKPGKQPVDA